MHKKDTKEKLEELSPTTTSSHFHAGEQEIQTRLGVREKMERFSKHVINSFMPEQHRDFYQQLPFVLIGHADGEDWPWATILFNEAGFITSEDNKKLRINSKPIAGEPFAEFLRENQRQSNRIGLLGIELSSRRRNRLAGHVTGVNGTSIDIEVDQAFGNCPQYIQTRELIKIDEDLQKETEVNSITQLNAEAKKLIENSDTFFVASYVQTDNESTPVNQGVDVSHRGGRPGFVRIDNSNTLTIPDYMGNFHFNTLGNFLLTPKAGLLFPDFETGHILTLTGTVEIIWETDDTKYFEGAERLWQFTIDHGYWIKNALPLRWKLDKYSPNTLLTGTWDEASKIQQAEVDKNRWQTYDITKIINESSVIKSFYLAPEKNQRPLFSAGQFITLKAVINDKEVIRTYTVSSSPNSDNYRISVKRETSNEAGIPDGLFSGYLHDKISVGDTLQLKAATGEFIYDEKSDRSSVLISAGVGITPMVSMAHFAAVEKLRTRSTKHLTVIHAARTHSERAFFKELKELEENSAGSLRCFWALSEIDETLEPYVDFNFHGRISSKFLKAILPLDDYDFYLCGPAGFMQDIYDLLRNLGVNDKRISAESFGPASLKRECDQASERFKPIPVAKEALIEFKKSNVTQVWSEGDGTLLEFAEAHGLLPEYGCRSGQCGSCKVKLLAGKISYQQTLQTPVADDEVLLCCAMPAKTSDQTLKIEIDL